MLYMLPTPKSCEVLREDTHTLPLAIFSDIEEWKDSVDAFRESFRKIFDCPLPKGEPAGILLVKDDTLGVDQYRIDSTEHLVLSASSKEGISYALASALQLLSCCAGELSVPSVRIYDYPDKEYRSFMLDSVSRFHPMDKLLKYVDLCFFYKIKYLHLHFADGAAYAYPSKAFPKLPTPKRHYTREQMAQLARYASARGITLIPEFECPGHANSLNRAYPEIFANRLDGDIGEYYTENGDRLVPDALVCAGSEKAFEGVRTLLAEIAELFPDSPYIHIGGDEAAHEIWNSCPACRAYMQEKGIADTKALYSEYVGRVANCVLELGRTPIVWEGFPKESAHYVPKETVVIAWESHYQLAPELLENGFRIVNCAWQPTYFVPSLTHRWGPGELLDWNVYEWQHWWEESAAYQNPIRVEPTDAVLGAGLCSWGLGYDLLITRILENFPAFSEKLWNVDGEMDFKTFYQIFKGVGGKGADLVLDRE